MSEGLRGLRIAHLHADLPGASHGGVAHQVDCLARAQARDGLDTTVYSSSPAPDGAAYPVERVAAPRWVAHRAVRPFLLSWFFRQLPLERYDAIHVHGDGHLLRRGLPIVRTFYGSALHEALSAWRPQRLLLQLAVYPTELLSALPARRCCGISRSTCRAIPGCQTLVPCGIDLERFAPGGEREMSPRLLFVGTLDGRKRGAWLLRRLSRIRREVPGAELVLVGPAPDRGAGWRSLGRVPLEELVEQYRRAWLYVSASRYEGFGIPLVEAMACGTPVLSTPTAGALEITGRGTHGLLAHPSLLAARAAALLRDPRRLAEWGARGRSRAQQFDIRQVARRYLAIYRELAGR